MCGIPRFFYRRGAHPLMWGECTSKCQPQCTNNIFLFQMWKIQVLYTRNIEHETIWKNPSLQREERRQIFVSLLLNLETLHERKQLRMMSKLWKHIVITSLKKKKKIGSPQYNVITKNTFLLQSYMNAKNTRTDSNLMPYIFR